MIRLLLVLLLGSSVVSAQDQPDNWFTDLAEAQAYARQHQGQILMVFAGSDWCKPCMTFKKDILESTDFVSYSKAQLAILYLDFPARKKNRLSRAQTEHNEALAEKFNPQGIFPKIVLITPEGVKLKLLEFKNQQPEHFITTVKQSIQ